MRVTPLLASTFTSDGSTMFGLVPKPIWSKRVQPDDQNRIPQHARSLLLELPDGRHGLVDTGCGSAENFSDKERSLSGLGPGWPLRDALSARDLQLEDIHFVIYTHVHWDHAGGSVAPASLGRALSFPNATHYLHQLEWEDASSGNPLLYKSYPPAIVAALSQARRELVRDDDAEILPGVRLIRSSGHTRGHCTVLLQGHDLVLNHPQPADQPASSGLLFAGDVCPSRHNLRMVFQTSYDTFPLDTRAWKLAWLPRIEREGLMLLFDHDPETLGGFVQSDPREEWTLHHTLPAPLPASVESTRSP